MMFSLSLLSALLVNPVRSRCTDGKLHVFLHFPLESIRSKFGTGIVVVGQFWKGSDELWPSSTATEKLTPIDHDQAYTHSGKADQMNQNQNPDFPPF